MLRWIAQARRRVVRLRRSGGCDVWFDVAEKSGTPTFLGYDTETAKSRLRPDSGRGAGTEVNGWIGSNRAEKTIFYAESGGQSGHGMIKRAV